jgi:hypothetical protein
VSGNTISVNGQTAKSFVIDHPLDSAKYLVHACLEGPEAGVYYRGSAAIPPNANSVELFLPEYVDALASDFTAHVMPVIDDAAEVIATLAVSKVKEGKFKVYTATCHSTPCAFDYLVFGNRFPIQVEPKKAEVVVKGSGPYTWL